MTVMLIKDVERKRDSTSARLFGVKSRLQSANEVNELFFLNYSQYFAEKTIEFELNYIVKFSKKSLVLRYQNREFIEI